MENIRSNNTFYTTYIKPNFPVTTKEWIYFMLVILVVITLGLIAVNQYLAISYKATLILNPCNLCKEFQDKMRYINTNGFDINLSNITILKG